MQDFDLVVLGSGSGLDVGIAAASSGLNVAIVEKGPLGEPASTGVAYHPRC